MGSSKVAPLPPRYSDNPGADSSSAVSLHSVNDDDDDDLPPPYSDDPSVPFTDSPDLSTVPVSAYRPINVIAPDLPTISLYGNSFTTHPPLPSSRADTTGKTTWTFHEPYSSDPTLLAQTLKLHARFPPQYHVHVRGCHEESSSDSQGKKSRNTVTDFDFSVDLTHTLSDRFGRWDPIADGRLTVLPGDRRGWRGRVLPGKTPDMWPLGEEEEEERVGDVNAVERTRRETDEALRRWCEDFCGNKAGWRSFALKRKIVGHNKNRVRDLVVSAIRGTGYQGYIDVSLEEKQNEVVFFTPGRINTLRTMVWVRWFFYLTFLWLISWPVLFFLTRRWAVVEATFQYRRPDGRAVVMDEGTWFAQWEWAIKRAALARQTGCVLDDSYRNDTRPEDVRGAMHRANGGILTGNSAVDGLVNVVGIGMDVVQGRRQGQACGWGGNC